MFRTKAICVYRNSGVIIAVIITVTILWSRMLGRVVSCAAPPSLQGRKWNASQAYSDVVFQLHGRLWTHCNYQGTHKHTLSVSHNSAISKINTDFQWFDIQPSSVKTQSHNTTSSMSKIPFIF